MCGELGLDNEISLHLLFTPSIHPERKQTIFSAEQPFILAQVQWDAKCQRHNCCFSTKAPKTTTLPNNNYHLIHVNQCKQSSTNLKNFCKNIWKLLSFNLIHVCHDRKVNSVDATASATSKFHLAHISPWSLIKSLSVYLCTYLLIYLSISRTR